MNKHFHFHLLAVQKHQHTSQQIQVFKSLSSVTAYESHENVNKIIFHKVYEHSYSSNKKKKQVLENGNWLSTILE